MKQIMKKEWNYALFLPIFLFYLLSIGVQYGAAVYDGKPVMDVVIRQIAFCVVSFTAMICVSKFKTAFLLKYSRIFYVVSLGIMSLLYWFYDRHMYELTNTKRWMRIAGISFQPSELVKLTFILFMVYLTLVYEKKYAVRTIKSDLQYVGKTLLFSLPTFLLMFMQKDFGTSLVFICILGTLYVISGVHWKILAVIITVAALIGGLLLLLVFTEWGNQLLYSLHFKTYQLDRVRAWADPFAYRDTIAYQQVQSILAIASGGLTGQSVGSPAVYVPVRESDMIFTVIGEKFGFLGGASVIFLYFYLFYQMMFTASKTNNKGAIYIAVTFVFSLVFQIFENIGAAIGLLPLTGIPLPFLSQGGTSLVMVGIGLGLILGLYPESNTRKRNFRYPPKRQTQS